MQITRPLVRYHGGKYKLADWIISHFPPHKVYTESFGGGGSVLLKKPRSYAEIYNDLDGEIVNLFKVVRDNGQQLTDKLKLTPFAREEFESAYIKSDDPIEQARKTVVKSFMGFGSTSIMEKDHKGSGFRTGSTNKQISAFPAGEWPSYAENLPSIVQRMRGVLIENKDAKLIMSSHDGEETLHYVDPPYVFSTRDKGDDYKHELSDDQHKELAVFLRGLKGKVVLSGYSSAMYDELYSGWSRVEIAALADKAKKRTEVLWMNFKLHRLI